MSETNLDLGKADWMWDEELGLHIPCCSKLKGRLRCGNGPLIGEAILTGDCGEHIPIIEAPKPTTDYEWQASEGYLTGLIKEPDLEAPWPSGMCGKKKVCETCPSTFLCTMKASEEMKAIRGRTKTHD